MANPGVQVDAPIRLQNLDYHFGIGNQRRQVGLYSWRYLYELGERQDEIWQTYLAELDARGLSRDP